MGTWKDIANRAWSRLRRTPRTDATTTAAPEPAPDASDAPTAAVPAEIASLMSSGNHESAMADAVEQLAWLNAENEIDSMVAKWQASIEHKPVVPITDAQGRIDDVLERAGPGVGLYGETTGIPVQMLIQMAEVGARSGRLWIRTVNDVLWFDLRHGRIARTGCEGPSTEGERLGEMLVGAGVLERDSYDEPLAEATRRRLPLGAVLLEKQIVTREQLQEAIRQQSILRLANALFAPEAAYAFCQDSSNVPSPIDNVEIDPRDLLEASGHMVGG